MSTMDSFMLLDAATRMAVLGHASQVRKDDNSPYIVHPFMVALLLKDHGFRDEVVAAGLVHDLVEDTIYTNEDIRHVLGDEVADLVAEVTHNDSLSWEDKKCTYIKTVRAASVEAKAIATADKIHNAESLLVSYEREGPKLWTYFSAGREKKLWFEKSMLSMLKDSWDHPLVTKYEELVKKMQKLV